MITKARRVYYNVNSGIVTASGRPLAGKVTVTENATGLEVTARDVRTRADPGLVEVEAVGEPPLVVALKGDKVVVSGPGGADASAEEWVAHGGA